MTAVVNISDQVKARAAKPGTDQAARLTEMDAAAIFEQKWRGKRVYEHRSRSWYVEDGGIWRRDECGTTVRAAQDLCKETGQPDFQTLKKAKAVEELARSAPDLAVTSDCFDRDPYMLGVPGGVVDLKNGKLLPPNPSLFISMSTSVAPDWNCPIPRWLEFLDQVTGGDKDAINFLKAWFGYCLTGDTREQKMLFAYGPGRNGKGVLLRVIAGIMATYAHRAQPETFTAGIDRHSTEIASMRGKRLTYCSETERSRKWAEGRIKDVTGGDKLRARFMRQDEFEFQPEFKLFVSGNYEPAIETADPAMRNRFFVFPFDQIFEGAKVDKDLDEKLKAEWPGILAWLIDGCRLWQASGLKPPAKVVEATAAYFDRQDVFAQWLEQETVQGKDLSDTNTRLLKSWTAFAKDNGEEPGNSKTFAERMNRSGFTGPHPTKIQNKSCRVYRGLKALIQ